MGDFAGGLLKYLRDHPIPKLTIAGGFAKLTKLAQGALDLHSSRSEVDRDFLAGLRADGRRERGAACRDRAAPTPRRKRWRSRSGTDLPLAALVADERARDGEGTCSARRRSRSTC